MTQKLYTETKSWDNLNEHIREAIERTRTGCGIWVDIPIQEALAEKDLETIVDTLDTHNANMRKLEADVASLNRLLYKALDEDNMAKAKECREAIQDIKDELVLMETQRLTYLNEKKQIRNTSAAYQRASTEKRYLRDAYWWKQGQHMMALFGEINPDCPDSIQAEINEFESIKKLKNFF